MERAGVDFLDISCTIPDSPIAACIDPGTFAQIAQFDGDEADRLISYLFAGRWDRSTICAGSQRHE